MNTHKSFPQIYSEYSQTEINQSFQNACSEGNLNLVRYLLTSDSLKFKADVYADEELGFRHAIFNGKLEIVKYLLDSPELEHHPKLHMDQDWLVVTAIENNYMDMAHYLIMERKIPKTEFIANVLLHERNEQVESWFNARDLNEKLNPLVSNFDSNERRPKI